MVAWKDTTFNYGKGKIMISGAAIKDAHDIILEISKKKSPIYYSDLMNRLKQRDHRKISRRTIGDIIGEVSNKVSSATAPSVYPSAVVIRKDSRAPGEGFWGLDAGTSPPSKVPSNHRKVALQQYQKNVFDWALKH